VRLSLKRHDEWNQLPSTEQCQRLLRNRSDRSNRSTQTVAQTTTPPLPLPATGARLPRNLECLARRRCSGFRTRPRSKARGCLASQWRAPKLSLCLPKRPRRRLFLRLTGSLPTTASGPLSASMGATRDWAAKHCHATHAADSSHQRRGPAPRALKSSRRHAVSLHPSSPPVPRG